jgi:hypothetical protein
MSRIHDKNQDALMVVNRALYAQRSNGVTTRQDLFDMAFVVSVLFCAAWALLEVLS